MASLADAVAALAPSFAGRLLLPADAGYDDHRHVHNGLIDRRPAVIAVCRGAADIGDAVRLARAQGLEIAVRGGGHNVAGRATVDDGLMIDLSAMRGVYVDPKARRARVGGGALWKDVNRETQLHGLATTGGVVSSTGVAGLTLGGGFGWLMPKHGMALDNVTAIDAVLADGRLVRASADEHPDLFWAMRGGGGNFGVAASFEFRLHEVGPIVTGGIVAHPYDRARDVLCFFRDQSRTLGDEAFSVGALLTGPDGSRLSAMALGHVGSAADGARVAAPYKAFGSPVLDVLGPMPYNQLNTMLDGSFPMGARSYWKSHFVPALPDDLIDVLVERFATAPSPQCQVLVEGFHGGAAARVPVGETAFALRATGFNVLILAQWTDPSGDAAGTAWARETYDALSPFVGPQRYLNYLDRDDTGERALAAAYGPNLARLRAIKATYDPENVFHLNVNITPRA